MPKLNWTTIDDIAYALWEKFPETDPTNIRFTDLHKWITELEGFEDDPLKSNEAKAGSNPNGVARRIQRREVIR